MHRHRQLLIIYVLIQFFVHLFASKHPGHLKPFGSSGPFRKIEELTDGFPDPITFFDKYVANLRPVIFRQALINDPYLSLWDKDENFEKIFLNNIDLVHVETRKKESRQQDILSITMPEFLQRYQHEELYLVEEVPNLLRPYFTLPTCLQCKPASETFQVAMFWFSSGNTSSVVHTDDYDNINCILQGDKQFILIDSYTFKEVSDEIIDNYSGSYSSIDVDRVDYNKYRSLNNNKLYYYDINLTKGDCFYLPYLWIHQVRSKGRNVAINYWLNHERVKNAIVNKETCSLNNQSDFLKLDTITWPKEASNTEHLRSFMISLVDEGYRNLKEWTREFSQDLNFDLRTDVDAIKLFAELFTVIDLNNNGLITKNEIELVFDTDKFKDVAEIIEEMLDIVDAKLDTQRRSNTSSMSDSDDEDEIDDNNPNINKTYFNDETEEDNEHDEL